MHDGSGFGILANKEIGVSQKGIDIVKEHLSGEFQDITNDAMIQRLEQALASGTKITGADARFYMHEVAEATLMNGGMPYKQSHNWVLKKYDVSPFSVYHPDVIKQYPEIFGLSFKKFGGIE